MAAAQAARRAQAEEAAVITASRRSMLERALSAAQAAAVGGAVEGESWTRAVPRLMAATAGAAGGGVPDGAPRLVQPAAAVTRPASPHWSEAFDGATARPFHLGVGEPLLTHVINPFRASSQEHTLAQRLTLASITAAAAAAKKAGVVVETLAAVLPRE